MVHLLLQERSDRKCIQSGSVDKCILAEMKRLSRLGVCGYSFSCKKNIDINTSIRVFIAT